MSELHSRQPTGGTGAAPSGRSLKEDPRAQPHEPPQPAADAKVGAEQAANAFRSTMGGTTGEGPSVGPA